MCVLIFFLVEKANNNIRRSADVTGNELNGRVALFSVSLAQLRARRSEQAERTHGCTPPPVATAFAEASIILDHISLPPCFSTLFFSSRQSH